MKAVSTRRQILKKTSFSGAAITLGNLGFLGSLPSVSAQEATSRPDIVRLRPEIEPLVRLIERTPRHQLLEEIAVRVRAGKLRYQQVLAALLLAGVRNVEPRPAVGFKFHAVLVVNSAHLASLASPDQERWLPIFWALDEFKASQAQDVREGNWTMGPVSESKLPSSHRARGAFIEAMENWDVEAADVAAASLARHCSEGEVYELFVRYGGRDFRSIGHKAIFVANSFRTLQVIGWQHAEPVLRSLAYALLNHHGQENPSKSDHTADRPWRVNETLAKSFPQEWTGGQIDSGATLDLLHTLREGEATDASRFVVELIKKGVSTKSIYDALFLRGGEMLMRQPGIIALHSMTTTNAMHYAFMTSRSAQTRRRLLLQNASFLPMFREAMKGRGEIGQQQIDHFQASSEGSLEGVLNLMGMDREVAASQLLGQLDGGVDPYQFVDSARRLVFLKGTNSHDYKFSSAVLEDFQYLSPEWRNRFLAASSYYLRGARSNDNELVKRAKDALKG